jgi:hypothetical protein
MRKTLSAGMAALTFAGAVATAALPTAAAADPHYRGGYGYDHHRGHRGNDAAGAAIVAGIAGLALGAALSNNHSNYGYYDRGYYDRGYYGRGYYDGGYYARPRLCTTERWVWDPYIGRRVPIRERYYC